MNTGQKLRAAHILLRKLDRLDLTPNVCPEWIELEAQGVEVTVEMVVENLMKKHSPKPKYGGKRCPHGDDHPSK